MDRNLLRRYSITAKEIEKNVEIKNVETSDLNEIVEIERMSFKNPWSKELFEDEIKSKSTMFLVAKVNNELIGYVVMRHINEEGHILNIAVHPEFRSLGVGKLLMNRLIEIANKLKLKDLYLEVGESNIIAKKLYHIFGFTEIGRRKRYYNNENGIMMWKRLPIFFVLFLFISSFLYTKPSYYLYLKGLVYKSYGDINGSIKLLETAEVYDPKAIQIKQELLKLYILTGQNKKISRVISDLQTLIDKEDIKSQMELTNLQFLYDPEEGAKKFEEIYNKTKDKNIAYILGTYYSKKAPEKALEYINYYLSIDTTTADIYILQGDIYMTLGNTESAKLSYEKSIALNPNLTLPYLHLIDIYRDQENYKMAIEKTEVLHKRDNSNPVYTLTLLHLYHTAKKVDKLENLIEKIKRNKLIDERLILFWSAKLYELKNDYHSAIKYLKKIKQKDVNIYLHMIYYYSHLNDYSNVIKNAKRAIKLNQNIPELHFFLGLGYFNRMNYKSAKSALLKAIELDDTYTEAYLHLGHICHTLNEHEECIKYLKKVLEIDPENSIAMNNLGYIYVEKNVNLDEAERLIKKALEYEPENIAYIDSLGWLYYKKGEYELAEKEFDKIIGKSNDPIIFDHAGEVKEKLGKYDEAIRYWKKALELKPKNKREIISKIKICRKKLNYLRQQK